MRGSAGGHNGVASLLEHLAGGFIRYRIGIGPKHPPEMDLKDFVLGKFTPDEQTLFNHQLTTYVDGLGLLIDRGPAEAMNQLNRRDPSPMTQTKRNYRATFILDNRGKEESIDQIIEGVKKEIAAVQGEVTAVENLGKKDFVRVTDRKLPAAVYVQVDFAAPARRPAPSSRAPPAQLQRLPHPGAGGVTARGAPPMAYLNKVFLIGNLTRDPELRVTPKGTAICQFGLAVNRQYKDESGATRDETAFIDIEAWGKQGELVLEVSPEGQPGLHRGPPALRLVGGQAERPEAQQAEGGARKRAIPHARPAVAAVAVAARGGGAGGRSAATSRRPNRMPPPRGGAKPAPAASRRSTTTCRFEPRPASPENLSPELPTRFPSWLTMKYC